MPSEDDDLTTLTVTISLDDDDGDHRHGLQENLLPASTSVLEKYYIIKSPIKPEHACPLPSDKFLIPDLPSNAQKLLCSRLNAPAIGSMKNWHYLAALIGIKDDDITMIRQSKDPMMEVIKLASTVSLSRLVTVIGDIGRIDVLISLKPFLHGLSVSRRVVARNAPIRHAPVMDEGFDSAAATTATISNFQFPAKKFIIVTYHETEKSNKKYVKLLLHNLQNVVDKCNFDIIVLDITKCIDETNISQTARNLFKHATQIVLFISSKDYITNISNSSINSPNNIESGSIRVKKLFHCWMDEEYHANACRNFRFRIVMNSTIKNNNDVLPSGWPQTTLHYTFPQQFEELCKRLFE
uniref:Uncharacterized protein n=1 Tax=Panagrolaimus sp. PS1159 TaxID=55785 RepID=A0AC35GE37_9BILA